MPNYKQIIVSGKQSQFPKEVHIERSDLPIYAENWDISVVSVSAHCINNYSGIIHITTDLVNEKANENGFEITKNSVLKTISVHALKGAKLTFNFEPIWFLVSNPNDIFKVTLVDALTNKPLDSSDHITIITTLLFRKA